MDLKPRSSKVVSLVSGGKTSFCDNFQIMVCFLHAKFGLATIVFFNTSVLSPTEDRSYCNSLLLHCLSKHKSTIKML